MSYKIFSSMFAVAIIILFLSACGNAPSSNEVAYPEGYRNWTHIKSLILEPGHDLYNAFGGIHHIYANSTSLGAYQKGGSFPDGSVIVFDLLEVVEGGNAIAEGNRKVVGVMQKDSKVFTKTGGWGFEGFKADTKERVVTDAYSQCFTCHMSQQEKDYVFSEYRK
jgi:hypothetical protein